MRLLDVETRRLHNFNNYDDVQRISGGYAILSHTWLRDDQEVHFEDIGHRRAKRRHGYEKLDFACKQAAQDGHPYLWMDTCCIDKSNSVELAEAINSMYQWYHDAAVCYAYLEDVRPITSHPIQKAKWFTRGWTLQELIAPADLIFYNSTWAELGTKVDMAPLISQITRINEALLRNRGLLSTFCIGRRLYWASKRTTTRAEDQAYCLLGLLDVALPMIYGEGGKRAFARLQEQIVRSSTDQSIFAWIPESAQMSSSRHMLFAPDPSCFSRSGELQSVADVLSDDHFELSNRGLRIRLPIIERDGSRFAILNCRTPRTGSFALRLHRADPFTSSKTSICFLDRDTIHMISGDANPEEIIILRESLTPEACIEVSFDNSVSDLQLLSMEPRAATSTGRPTMELIADEPRQFREGYLMIRAPSTDDSLGGDLLALLQMGQFLRQDNSWSTFRLHWHTATNGQDLVQPRPDLSLKSPSLVSHLQDLRHMSISPAAMDSKHWIEAKAELLSREGTAIEHPSVTVWNSNGQQEPPAPTGLYWSVVISASSTPGHTPRVKKRLSEYILGPLTVARKPALPPRSISSKASTTGSEKT